MNLNSCRSPISSIPRSRRSKRMYGARLLAGSIITFVALSVCSSNVLADQATFQLGGHKLGERLSHFRVSFPGAACGTPMATTINRHTLGDPDDSGWITCCVDDPQQLAEFSKFRVLSLDGDCRLQFDFYNERLRSVHYAVAVTSLKEILPEFIKSYGPIQQQRTLLSRPHFSNKLVAWWHDEAVMELNFEYLDVKEVTDARYDKPNHPYAEVTIVDLWTN